MRLLPLLLLTATLASAQTQLTTSELQQLYTTRQGSTVSIHDPSIVARDGQYTIWGSHLGLATSTDLITWTTHKATFLDAAGQPCDPAEAFNTPALDAAPQIDAEAYSARYGDAETWIYGNMWAPDIIYNEALQKWTMYLSLNGEHWNSIIVMLAGDSPTGPFTYQGPIVMGGFNGQTYGGVKAPTIDETDYTRATGETTLPARYITTRNGDLWPNPIDPCVFYDEEGELWMTYGSWSGGIFMLKLDKATGLRDYTYTYPSDYDLQGASGTSDPYYGRKIAGGYYVSGEGSYVQHIGQYYYLFMSYGGLEPDGGYQMRIFRSAEPTGPYTDAAGNPALYDRYQLNYGPRAATDRGCLLLAAYNHWGNQTVGETAQGHNSAFVDQDGRAYVVYHTKFNNGTKGHQVRLRELYVNEKGWLVAAPFIASKNSKVAINNSELPGTYHLLHHPYRQDHAAMQEATPEDITLHADGTLTGAYSGTWNVRDQHITLRLGSTTYYGVLCRDAVSGATPQGLGLTTLQTVGFTAQSLQGVSLWGYRLADPHAVAYNYLSNTIPLQAGKTYSSNIPLVFPTVENTTLTWTSSEPDIISETGKYNPAGLTEAKDVTLTARLTCGTHFWTQAYNVKAQKEITPAGDCRTSLCAYYPFDDTPALNAYNAEQRAIMSGTDKPTLADDPARFGRVLHHRQGASTTKMPSPFLTGDTLHGLTLSMWVKPTTAEGCLWSLFSGLSANAKGAHLMLTADSRLTFDSNDGTTFTLTLPALPPKEWTLLTVTVGPQNGIAVYYAGAKKTPTSITASNSATTARALPLDAVLSAARTLRYLYLGLGPATASPDCLIDELTAYSRELTTTDVRCLTTTMNRVHDLTPEATGIQNSKLKINNAPAYDLAGRPTLRHKGLHIVGGRKIIRF